MGSPECIHPPQQTWNQLVRNPKFVIDNRGVSTLDSSQLTSSNAPGVDKVTQCHGYSRPEDGKLARLERHLGNSWA